MLKRYIPHIIAALVWAYVGYCFYEWYNIKRLWPDEYDFKVVPSSWLCVK